MKQYWTESAERVGIIEKVMNDGSIGSTFNEGMMKVEGETAYCIDINTDFKNGYKTRADASSRMSADQISDVALSLEYVKQYSEAHKELNYKQVYLLEQCVVWQRLSVHLGWQCDNVRASYDEIPKATQDEVFSGAKAFVKENKGRYECGGYIYSGEGQELGQFWTKLNVGNAKLQKTSSNTSITNGNGNYSVAGAIYGVFSDKDCTKQLLINGKRVESDYTFIADSETMKVEVAFTFDATSLDGKQLVTFEELYDLSNPDEPKKVTEHKDIEDKGQTITFKEKLEEPEKPETPPTPEKPNRPSDSPKTGDSTNVMAFIVMLLASAGGLAGTYLYKRRKMKKS